MCVHMYNLCLWVMKVGCVRHAPRSLKTSVFPEKKDIVPYNHETVTKFRRFKLIQNISSL